MRIEAIRLPAFGPFTNEALDFSRGQGKLEIVYGPNEAGKSSLLRAISALLFGVPVQTGDNFRHDNPNLRIGAAISHEGRTLQFIRRKGSKNTLLAADGVTGLAERDFRAVVPIESQDLFHTMFGLDAGRLAAGAGELIEGKGEFGQLLFSAATGIEGLRSILEKLSGEAAELFKGKNSEIMRQIGALEEAKKKLRAAQFTARELDELQNSHDEARTRLEALRAGLSQKSTELSRLERIRACLGLYGRLKKYREELELYASVPLLRDGFEKEHGDLNQALSRHGTQRGVLRQRTEELRSEIGGLIFPRAFLDRETAIHHLYQSIGERRKAAEDKLKLVGQLRSVETGIGVLLADLALAPGIEAAPRLHVPVGDKSAAGELADSHIKLSGGLRSVHRELAELESEIDTNRLALHSLPEPKSTAAVKLALESLTGLPAPPRLDAEAERKLHDEIRALPWSGTPQSLAASALPSEAVVNEWRTRFDAAQSDVRNAAQRLVEAEEELRRRQSAIDKRKAGRSIPTLESLESERRRRDLGWRAVRAAWLHSDPDSGEARAFLAAPADSTRLAEAYSASVVSSDQIADGLREHASDVVRLAQDELALREAVEVRDVRLAAHEKAAGQMAAVRSQWAGLWSPWGLASDSPAQAVDWLANRARLLLRLDHFDQQKAEMGDRQERIDAAILQSREALQALGETAMPVSASLAAWRSALQTVLERQSALEHRRASLQESIAGAEKKLASARLRASEAAGDLKSWRGQWTALLARLDLDPAMEPGPVKAILEKREKLQVELASRKSFADRIDGIDRDQSLFEKEAATLAAALDPELAALPFLEIAARLHNMLAAHKSTRDRRVSKENDLAAEEERLRGVETNLSTVDSALVALAAEAGCGAIAEIPARVEASRARADLARKVSDAEDQFAEITLGRPLAELEEVNPDELPGRIESLAGELKLLREREVGFIQAEYELAGQLRSLDTRTGALAAAADQQSARAAILEQCENFIRLRLAEHVLRTAIDEHRRKASGPMLKRSSEIFAGLTLGAFERLDLRWGDADDPILVGVRSAGEETVPVDGMSGGTRDQLYLALRLASLELYFRDHPRVPLIVDDILVSFDDHRAAAALKALARLASHTQVLLFTHHHHLVALAGQSLNLDELAVVRMGSASATQGAPSR